MSPCESSYLDDFKRKRDAATFPTIILKNTMYFVAYSANYYNCFLV